MTKKFRLTTHHGFVYEFDAHIVADNRAVYYASRESDNDEEYKEVYDDEYKYAMKDNVILKDWFHGNMDWSQVRDSVTIVERPIEPLEPLQFLKKAEIVDK
ncbi:hypothetical protein AU106_gp060 [Sinorhizobium phage phiM9]|uniref:Uncharacterized protein n=1 Tax=Sinorhizobium phage phiM9 TaxID=1636182 RepID=A0A0F6TH29_9CAUD|nr:hypothetical protein AU106_gp060 [Sinorhizobium phage phiM9]AKE44691.1 hypothetical protein Sm_phiM9_061 [Sinorhizobium phage phiM9]